MSDECLLDEAAPEDLRVAVRERYDAIARDPGFDANFPVGREHALAVGYPAEMLAPIPEGVVDCFAGPAAPVLSAEITTGKRVLDLGCGAGMDASIAAAATGNAGTVVGVDASVEMVKRGRRRLGEGSVQGSMTAGHGAHLPFRDGAFDVVVANGLLNLEPDREGVVREIARVMEVGGRLVGAEVILVEEVDRSAFTVSDWFR